MSTTKKKIAQDKKNIKKKTDEQRAHYLKPVDQILDRIKWDAILNKELDDFIIGYKDRFLGIMETTIQEYEEGALIPFHRIYYLKFHGNVIWDREKRLDMVSNGQVYQYAKHTGTTPTPTTPMTPSVFDQAPPTPDSVVSTNSSIPDVPTKPEENSTGVIFSQHKKRKIYQPYDPEDTLESWMLANNTRALALSDPTHVSQRGGYYHIDSELNDELFESWAQSLNEKFFMEEFRGDLFRLYVDIDIKLTKSEPFNMIEAGWLPLIVQTAQDYFGLSSENKSAQLDASTCLVTECHSEWSDASTTSAVYKSGYRIYFTSIYVDFETMEHFVKLVAKKMKALGNPLYEGQPASWTLEDIIDVKGCGHDKARMFGTVKFRRGNEIPRKYSFVGVFDSMGELDKAKTSLLKSNVKGMLRLLSVRFDEDEFKLIESEDEKDFVNKAIVSTKKGQQKHFVSFAVPLN